jgi:hypothetical protein
LYYSAAPLTHLRLVKVIIRAITFVLAARLLWNEYANNSKSINVQASIP